MVDEHAVSAVGQIQRDVLVALLGARAAVLVVNVHALAVLDERAEALAHAVDQLADGEVELAAHVGILRAAVVGHARPVGLAIGDVAVAAAGQALAAVVKRHLRVVFVYANLELARARGDRLAVLRRVKGAVLGQVQFKVRSLVRKARVMGDAHADDALHRRRQLDGQVHAAQRVAASDDALRRAQQAHALAAHLRVIDVGGRKAAHKLLGQPLSV